MDKKLKRTELDNYLKKINYKYNIDDIYNFYLSNTDKNLPNTPIKLIKELEKRALILNCTVLEYIKDEYNYSYIKTKRIVNDNNLNTQLLTKRIVNGNNLNTQLLTKKIFDITNDDKLINLELKCFIVTNYKPFDDNELNKYRNQIKSYNCLCKDKNCMSILKKIKQPKLADYKDFSEDDHEYVKKINFYFLDQYYDSHSRSERIMLSNTLRNINYLQSKINLYKIITS